MVRNNNPIAPNLNRLFRIRNMLDPLEHKRLAARDPPPSLHNPRHLLPRMCTAVPHIINPLGARLVGHSLRIDPSLLQPLLENRIAESQIRPDAVVEGVVGVGDVVVPPPELPRVEGQNTGAETGLVSPRQQRNRQLIIVRQVQLEEPRSFTIGFADIFDRLAARCRQAVRQVQFFGDFRHGQFACGVVDFVDADGSEADGRRDFVAEDGGRGVAVVGVAQHSRDDAVAVEGLSVCEVGGGHAGVGGGVVPAAFGEFFAGAVF
jgi:hypothetical protein